MARNPKVELRGHEGQVVHPITDGDCVIFPSGETLSHKLSEQEEVMYAPEVTNSSPMFKVGEGDSADYSANVLDGAYQEAILKGQTYVNTIQEPSADVITLPTPFTEYERTQSKTFTEMQDGTFGLNLVGQSYVNCIQEPSEPSYVALGEALEFQNKKVEYTNDGQIKSAMLKGQTLVNHYAEENEYKSQNAHMAKTGNEYKIYKHPNYIGYPSNRIKLNNIEAGKTYTLIFDYKATMEINGYVGFTEDNGSTSWNIRTHKLNMTTSYKKAKLLVQASRSEYNWLSFTNGLNAWTTEYDNLEVYLKNIIVVEGDHTQEDIPYFQGMQSVTMSTELENVCSRYNSSIAKNGKTFTVGTWENRGLKLSEVANISNYNFKQNTKYLMQFKISNLNLDGLENIKLYFSENDISTGNSLFGNLANAMVRITKNGIYKVVLTTSSIVSTSHFVIKGLGSEWESSTSTSRKLTISQIMCIEYQNGMENWDLPYFETTQLMKPLKVQSANKNVLNIPLTFKVAYQNGEQLVWDNYWGTKDYVRVQPNTTYTFSNSLNKYIYYGIVFYNRAKQVVYWQNNNIGKTFTTTSDTYYVRFSLNSSVTDEPLNCQLEESSTATDYVPHQEKTISALEPITLRAIGNVKDTLDLSTGEYVQRIGEIVLDGSEGIVWGVASDDGKLATTICFTTYGYIKDAIMNSAICSHFQQRYSREDIEHFYNENLNSHQALVFFINRDKLTTPDYDGFNQWLSKNPIKIQYQLAIPITRKISLEYPNLQTYTDITHVQSIAMDGTLIPKIFLPSDISYKAMLKPNTSYNVIVDREVIDSTNQLTVNLGGTTANITANRTVVRTPSTLSNETLTFSGKDNRIAKAMLIEGSTLINGDLPHFDGIGDVKLGRVVENLCMANHTTVGGAASTDTLYSDKITSKITQTGSKVHIFQLTKNLLNDKKYFIYCPYDYQYIIYGFRHEYNNSLSYTYQSCEGVNKKYAIIRIDGNQQKNPYTHFTVGCHGNIPVNTTMTIRRPILCEYVDGMENWDWESIGYFTGTKNVGNEFMRIGNKNLFGEVVNRYWDAPFTNGNETIRPVPRDNAYSVRNIKVKKGRTYTASGNGFTRSVIAYFKTNSIDELPFDGSLQNFNYTFTSKYDGYVEWYLSNDNVNNPVTNVQIEEASSATSYVAHKHNSLHILPNEQIPLTFVQGATIFSTTTSFAEQSNNTMASRIRTGLLDLEPNETYRISCGDKNYIQATAFYNNSNIGAYTLGGNSDDCIFTTTKDVHKICINIAKSDLNSNISPSVLHQVRLEKVTDVTLRGIWDVKDELDLTRGVYLQRIGEVVLNGGEDWRVYNDATNPDNYTNSYRTFFVVSRKSVGILANCQLYSDKYKTYIEKPKDITEKGFVYAGSSNLNVVELANMTVDEFKEKISLNPITIQYPLETPIEHKINIPMKNEANQTIAKPNGIFTLPLMYSETNHVDINSQIYPKVQSRDYISYPVIANNSQLHTVFHNKVGTGNLTVNLCGTNVTSVDGTSKCTITTPSTISQYELRLSGARNKVSNVCVFNGDYMNVNVPYVQGMMNAVNPTVTNIGKNLFDGELEQGSINSNNGSLIVTATAIRCINYIKLKQNTLYTISKSKGTKTITILFYDKDKKFTRAGWDSTFILKNNEYYIKFTDGENDLTNNYQLEESPTPSQYEPYKENICEPDYGQVYLIQDMFEQGTMSGVNGAEYDKATSNARIRTKELVKIKSSTSYIFKMNDNYNVWIKEFDAEGKQSTVSVVAWLNNGIFTTKENTEYISFIIGKVTNNTSISVSEFDNINPYLCELDKKITLRSLPNGVRDELNLQTGEYIQRIGEIVLDGNIDTSLIPYINKRGTVIENRTALYTKVAIKEATMYGEWVSTIPTKFITNRLINDTTNAYYAYMPNTIAKSDGSIQICIDTDLLETETKEGVIKYFSENPIIFIGELKTPIVKQIDINNFPHSYKDGHVIIESGDTSTNVTAQMTYQCVANRTGQIQEHTEQIEKQEHEINELEMLILENIRQQQNR